MSLGFLTRTSEIHPRFGRLLIIAGFGIGFIRRYRGRVAEPYWRGWSNRYRPPDNLATRQIAKRAGYSSTATRTAIGPHKVHIRWEGVGHLDDDQPWCRARQGWH